MKVAFPDSDEDVDDGVKILPLTTLFDDANADDDDDDRDNLDKKPPARLMIIMEQTGLLEEQRKKYREMVMEIEDSDSEASDVGMTEAQKLHATNTLMASKNRTQLKTNLQRRNLT